MQVTFQSMKDEELMQFIMKNDQLAWSEMINRYGGLVYSIAYQILKNQSDAEDASQNTFIRLKIYSRKFKENSVLKPWLSKIASGEAIRIYNQKRSINKKESQRMMAQESSNENDQNSALENLEKKELEVLVKMAIDSLPETSRVAVTLYYVGGYSQNEIAKELGLSQFSISEKINIGLEKIRAYLKKSGIKTTVILSPSLIQDSFLSQSIPISLETKINTSITMQSSIVEPGSYSASMTKASFYLKSINFYLVSGSIILMIVASLTYFKSIKPTEDTAIKDASKITTPIVKNENMNSFEPVDYSKNVLVELVYLDKESDLLNGGQFLLLPKPTTKWNLLTDKKNNPIIMRSSMAKNESQKTRAFDGFYIGKPHQTPQVYQGEIKYIGVKDSIALFVTTPKEGKVYENLNWQESSADSFSVKTKSLAKSVYTISASKSVIISFKVFIYPMDGKIVSTSFVVSNTNDFVNFRSVQMATQTKQFYFGIISNGDVQISQLKSYDLGENWDFKKEGEFLKASEKYQGNLWEDMTQSTTQFAIKNVGK